MAEDIEHTQLDACFKLRRALYSSNSVRQLRTELERVGAVPDHVWKGEVPPDGPGYSACTATMEVEGQTVLILVFRGTVDTDEWLRYPFSFFTEMGTLLSGRENPSIYQQWDDILNLIWDTAGTPASGLSGDACSGADTGAGADGASSSTVTTVRGGPMQVIVRDWLTNGKRVWITGHSKGGALATAAAYRLVCRDRPRRFNRDNLRHLSVLTYNAPKAVRITAAENYNSQRRSLGVTHRTMYNPEDSVRNLPPFASLCHVGTEERCEPPASWNDVAMFAISRGSSAVIRAWH